MAEDSTPNESLPETVSKEAHQRMTDERNDLKAEVKTLSGTVRDLGLVDKARKHFIEKGVADPEWAADIALPTILAEGEVADVGAFLDDKFARLYPEKKEPGSEQSVADDGIPSPDAVEPPGFARPSPAAEGTPPGQKKYKYTDPEIQKLIQDNDNEGLKKLADAGQIDWVSTAPLVPG